MIRTSKRQRNKKGTVLVEYALALGAIAGTATYAFAILGFNTAVLVRQFDNCIAWGCGAMTACAPELFDAACGPCSTNGGGGGAAGAKK